MKRVGFAVACLITAVQFNLAQAAEVVFCWGDLKKVPLNHGTQRVDDYDVAIRIADPSLVGQKITKISVPFDEQASATDFSIWLSSELKIDRVDGVKQNVPDILSKKVELEKGRLTLVLDEPYEMPETGLYAGYSFKINALNDFSDSYPVSVYSAKANDDSFMMHTSRKLLKWTSVSADINGASAIEVTFEGDFEKANLSLSGPTILDAGLDDPSIPLDMTYTNFADMEIEEIEYTWQINDMAPEVVTVQMPYPQYAQFGLAQKFKQSIPNRLQVGENLITVKITKVNGETNTSGYAEMQTKVFIHDILPIKRPLVEEYTGFWCGNCTRGYAALEYMNEKHPDRFIAVSIHDGDELEVMPGTSRPKSVGGLPGAWIDRDYEVDPYHGRLGRGSFNLESDWELQCEQFCPVKLDVEATKRSETDPVIDVKATATFIRDMEENVAMVYYLLADGMENPRWLQHNYYTAADYPMELREMDRFTRDGAGIVNDLVWNDILIMYSNPKGESGSLPLPGEIEKNKPLESAYQFNTEKAYSLQEVNFLSYAKQLRVVASVVDTDSGKIFNSAVCRVKGFGNDGVESPAEEMKVVSEEYYDLQGMRTYSPSNGVYVRLSRYEDGIVKTEKVIFK